MSTITPYQLPSDGLVPLFVYGTLRPGGRLHPMLAPAVLSSTPATADGLALHWVRPARAGYPVAVPDADSVTYGDLLFCRPCEELTETAQMEWWAGYSIEIRTVTTPGGPIGAYVFVWKRPDGIGPAIETGDFLAELVGSR